MPRYFGEEREEKKEANPILRGIAARAWYLVIPLIALGWYHTKVVTPRVNAVSAQILADQKAIEAQRGTILSDARKLGVETSRLKAEADTFSVRATQFSALLDTVRMVVDSQVAETRKLEAQSDSLRTIISEAEGNATRYSDSLVAMQARVDSLRALIEGRQAMTAKLQQEIAVDQDLADRILRPGVYRKNSALVTGHGDFPNRDALPKR
jgi:hypothetical protein